MNVSAGIGIISVASPLLQEIFGGKLIGVNTTYSALSVSQKELVATFGAAFLGLLSLFNIFGRFFWASLSDHLGRKWTYHIFFALGMALYYMTAFAAIHKNITLFVGMCSVILTMYGGGFATIPAYLADLFGTQFVGAIHGRLLTAWSTAAVIGPFLITYIHKSQLNRGVASDAAYNVTLYILGGLLFIGFICNLLVRPISKRHFMSDEELAKARKAAHEQTDTSNEAIGTVDYSRTSLFSWIKVVCAWAFVGIPLAWGVTMTVAKAITFFK
jgi:MFS family permease